MRSHAPEQKKVPHQQRRDPLLQQALEDVEALRKLKLLSADVGQALTQKNSLQGMLQHCCAAFVHHLGTAFACLWTRNNETHMLELKASAGESTHLDGAQNRMRVGALRVGRILQTSRPFLTNDLIHDSYIDDHDWVEREHILAFAGYPLIVEEQTLGVLALFARGPIPQETFAMLTPVADTIAQGIGRKWAEARLEEMRSMTVLQERQRLARELHDSVSQELYSMSLHAQTALEALETEPSEAVEALHQLFWHAQTAIAEMRALLFELLPESLQREGLLGALHKQVAILQTRYQLTVHVSFGKEPETSIEVKHVLYRLVLEALHNVVKHAHASTVTLRLAEEDGALLLEVSDNGRGFEPTSPFSGHLGLHVMRERVATLDGTLSIKSARGKGTMIVVRIPRSSA